jgi:branched-chain amino acid aminotransferase
MHDRDGFIWHDGALVPWRDAKTHVLTHSLHYGLAIFEGVRAYSTPEGTALFRVLEHTERLLGSARIYRMPLPYGRDELVAAQAEAVRANRLSSAYVRTIAYYGAEKVGVNPEGAAVHVAIAAFPWGAYLGPDSQARGIRVKTSSFVRSPVNASLPRAKLSASYANSILAHREAKEDGYDEALLLDVEGFVAEGAGENLFLVRRGTLHEPEPTSALTGITRDTVRALASELGLEVRTHRLTRDDVYLADEAFFCGTAAEITPIVELDRRTIGEGRPGPVTGRLLEAFRAAVSGREDRHRDWLRLIEPQSAAQPSGASITTE